ncbi:MAG: hypothetical protein Q9195_003433 [Heterodermia aff. obscurata]
MDHMSGHVHRIVHVHLSNGTHMVLKLSPSSSTEVLRHERRSLAGEACTLSLLAKSKLPVPRVFKYDSRCKQIDSPFLLTTHLPGIPYANVRPYQTHSERSGIERQIRSLSSIVGQHTWPKFGPVALEGGHDTWREAFLAMLESVLMDGEDKLVSLPYSQIRDEAVRFSGWLDAIKQARLVVVGLGQPENVLIDRTTNEVTGLIDFGRAMWADPDLMTAPTRKTPKTLLYICYNSIVTIVTNHYRPSDESQELDARKALTTALNELLCMTT